MASGSMVGSRTSGWDSNISSANMKVKTTRKGKAKGKEQSQTQLVSKSGKPEGRQKRRAWCNMGERYVIQCDSIFNIFYKSFGRPDTHTTHPVTLAPQRPLTNLTLQHANLYFT